eukprot:TRINITY_DN66186_c6_g7_i1.p1 TRINITY_DN66186_c6_g7~~TRINITY_DN66186_c6_g7_i1.p1  ORF type:complete len:712 (-),score=467.32 TRINITY_DN66186_c6_g7_i1:812-2731(-)
MNDRLGVANDLAAVVCALLDASEFPQLLRTLHGGLADPEIDSAIGAAAMCRTLVDRRGAELLNTLQSQVDGIIASIRNKPQPVVDKMLTTVRRLAEVHFKDFIDLLLDQKLPISTEVATIFRALADREAGDLAARTLKYLVSVINDTPLLEDKPVNKVTMATSALTEVLGEQPVSELLRDADTSRMYAPVLATVLMRVGTAYGVDDGVSSKSAVQAVRAFFKSSGDVLVTRGIDEDTWSRMHGAKFDDGVAACVKALFTASKGGSGSGSGSDDDEENKNGDDENDDGDAKRGDDELERKRDEDQLLDEDAADLLPPQASDPQLRQNVINICSKFLSQQRVYGQRVVATTVLAQMLLHCGDDSTLLDQLIQHLLPRVTDKKPKVRKQALRGLGNLEEVWNESLHAQATSILSALTSAAEDQIAPVAAEAVASMTRVVRVVAPQTIMPMLINICYRMRTAFDRKEVEVRTASFALFGELTRFGSSGSTNFLDQMHANMVTVLVHVNDEEESVREAAFGALQRVAASLEFEGLVTILEEDGQPDPALYDVFADRVATVLVEVAAGRVSGYLDACGGYYKSDWSVVRANAASLAGHLLAHASAETRQRVNVHAQCLLLIRLLDQDSGVVRTKAAKALSLLHDV